MLYRVAAGSSSGDVIALLGKIQGKPHVWISTGGKISSDFAASPGLTDALFIDGDKRIALSYANGIGGAIEVRELNGRVLVRSTSPGDLYEVVADNKTSVDVLSVDGARSEIYRYDLRVHRFVQIGTLPVKTKSFGRTNDVFAYENPRTHATEFQRLRDGSMYSTPVWGDAIACDPSTNRCFVLTGPPDHRVAVVIDAETGLPMLTVSLITRAVTIAIGDGGTLFAGGGPVGGWLYQQSANGGFPSSD